MSAAGARLRAFTAAVNQLTAAISSSSGSHAAGSPQLQAMASRLFRDSGVVPAGPLLGRDEQAALAALLGAFQATAAERHARDRQWLELLFPQVAAFCFMLDKLLADEKAVEGWLQRQGGAWGATSGCQCQVQDERVPVPGAPAHQARPAQQPLPRVGR